MSAVFVCYLLSAGCNYPIRFAITVHITTSHSLSFQNPLKRRPDLFFIDWTLPGYSKWGFVRALDAALLERHTNTQGRPAVTQCPLLLFTPAIGFPKEEGPPMLRYLSSPMDTHKPVRRYSLYNAIIRLLEEDMAKIPYTLDGAGPMLAPQAVESSNEVSDPCRNLLLVARLASGEGLDSQLGSWRRLGHHIDVVHGTALNILHSASYIQQSI
jgi:hypothetical protein